MKSLRLVPPAQAEALYDAQMNTQRNAQEVSLLENRFEDRLARLPWTDDDGSEETAPTAKFNEHYPVCRKAA